MKQEIVLRAKSSDKNNFYDVTFTNNNGLIKIVCGCRAGIFSWIYKHKIALLRGDSTILFDDIQRKELEEVINWLNKSSFPKLTKEYNIIEDEYFQLKEQLDLLKNQYNEMEDLEDENGTEVPGVGILRFDLLKKYLDNIRNRDQQYYDNRNPYNNPEYLKVEEDFLKKEAEFKTIKTIMKSAMKNGVQRHRLTCFPAFPLA